MKTLAILCAFISTALYSQNSFFYFRYTTEEGLANNTIYDVKESPNGVITIATDNGISFFNGQSFRNINTQDGLEKPYIIAIQYAKNSDLYIANYFGNIQVLHTNGSITRLAVKSESTEEIGLYNSELYLKKTDNSYEGNQSKIGYQFTHIHGKNSDITILNYTENHIKLPEVKDVPFFNNNQETAIIRNRIAYFGTKSFAIPKHLPSVFAAIRYQNNGLVFTQNEFHILTEKGTILKTEKLPFSLVNSINRFRICVDKQNRIWLSLQKRGLFVYENNSWRKLNQNLGLSDQENINNLYCDSSGKMWIATNEKGLYCIPNIEITHQYTNSNSDFFNSFFVHNNQLYTCNRWNLYQVTSHKLKPIHTIFNELKLEFSLGYTNHKPSFYGLPKEFLSTQILPETENYSFRKTIRLPNGNTLNYFGRELYLFDKNHVSEYINFHQFKNEKIYNIILYQNKLIANVGNRLFYFHLKNKTFFEDRDLKYKPKGFVSDIAVHQNQLLIAENNALHYCNLKEITKSITEINGIKLEQINKIKVVQNEIWILATNGLFRISERGNLVLNSFNFLPDDDVKSIFFYKNNLYVGTKNGLATVPEKLLVKSKIPSIKSLYYYPEQKQKRIENQYISLKSDENYVKIEIDIQNFQSKKNQIVSFRLDDSTWRELSQNYVELYSFPYGEHELHIRIKDVNSDWMYQTIRVDKAYPFYLTFWFWLVAIAGISLLLYALYRRRIQIVRQKLLEQQSINNKMVELRQSALSAMMNPHFIFNSLSAIQYFVNTKQAHISSEYIAKLSRLVRLFLHHSAEPTISLADEIHRLQLYVSLEQLRFYPFEFTVSIDAVSHPEKLHIPNMILQPFIENAILHGISQLDSKDGIITLAVTLEGNTLSIRISDNGFGLSLEKKSSTHISKGISIIKERLESMQKVYPTKTFCVEEMPLHPEKTRKGHLIIVTLTVL